MSIKQEKGQVGQSFEAFLQEEGRLEESTQQAVKRVIAFELEQAMKDRNITKTQLAAQLKTSRTQLNRLLDPQNAGITLDSLVKAAQAVGRELHIELH